MLSPVCTSRRLFEAGSMLSHVTRPRRSCLSVPGSSERMLVKARSLPADEVVIDLEDAVAPAQKDEARAATVAALGQDDWEVRSIAVRVNGTDTPWFERDVRDLADRFGETFGSIVVPKVESAAGLAPLEDLAGSLGVQALIETAAGVARV